jgi:hypothetical protein
MVCFKYTIVYTLQKGDNKDDDDGDDIHMYACMYVCMYEHVQTFIPGQYYYLCGCVPIKYDVSKRDVNFIASVDSRMFHRE